FGHSVEGGPPWTVRRGAGAVRRYATPADYSSALPLAAAVGAAGGEAALLGLRWPSIDADARAVPLLQTLGVSSAPAAPRGVVSAPTSSGLRPSSAVASGFPDAVPSLAALAMLAPGRSVFSGIGHLRWKESDRIASLEALAAAVGASATASADALTIDGPAR